MSHSEIYSACIYACLAIASFVFGGLAGFILMNIGFWVGAIDVGWVDDLFSKRPEPEPEEEEEKEDPGQPSSFPNVIQLPRRRFGP